MSHTIGIAAECVSVTDEGKQDYSEPGVILCTDQRIDFDYAASDIGNKFHGLGTGSGWGTLMAGPVNKSLELINTLVDNMSGAPSGMTSQEALKRIRNAVRQQREKWIDEALGRLWGVTFEDFKTIGKEQWPAEMISAINSHITYMPFECEMLLAKVSSVWPQIFSIKEGLVELARPFAVIGSGGYLAHSSLIQRGFRSSMVFNEAIYCVYEAKRMSEKNTGVGPETEIFIVHRNVVRKVTTEGLAYLDEQYKRLSIQPLECAAYPGSGLNKVYGL